LDLQTEELEGETLEFLQTDGSVPFSLELLAANQECTRIQAEFLDGDDVGNAMPDPSARRGARDSELGKEIGLSRCDNDAFQAMVVRPMPRHGEFYDNRLSAEFSANCCSNPGRRSTVVGARTCENYERTSKWTLRRSTTLSSRTQRPFRFGVGDASRQIGPKVLREDPPASAQ
jgi:hypothetical protein